MNMNNDEIERLLRKIDEKLIGIGLILSLILGAIIGYVIFA